MSLEEALDLKKTAIEYHAAGWHPLEIPARAKEPVRVGLTGRAGVDMTVEQIAAAPWGGNIGLRMPTDVIGIDVDCYKGGGATLAELETRLGPLPPTWVSHSNRNDGSGIRFFRVPPGFVWVSGVPGIEVVQRGYRYAMAPPSIHPEGRRYDWLDQAEDAPVAGVPLVEDLPELPWAWVNELSRASAGDVEAPSLAATLDEVSEFMAAHTQADAPSYISVIVADFTEQTGRGRSRHDTMTHCLIWALEHVRAGIAPAESTVKQLADLWAEALAEDPRRAELWSDRRPTEFEAMVRHAVGKANAKTEEQLFHLRNNLGVGATFNVPPSNGQGPTAVVERIEPVTTAGSAAVDGATFLLDYPGDGPARWGRGGEILWQHGESLLLCGPSGVGKTTLAGQLVGGLIGVLPDVLGYPLLPAKRVLYLAMDRPRQIRRAMQRLLGPAHRQALAERLVVRSGPLLHDIGRRPETLLELAQQFGADVIICDSLKDAAVKVSDEEVGGNVNRAVQQCNVADVDVMFLHHQRKGSDGRKPKTLEDVYGSVFIPAGSGSVVLLWGEAGSELVELTHLKQPAELVGPLEIEHDHHAGTSKVTKGWDALAYLTKRGAGGATTAEAVQAHHGSPQKAGEAKWKQTERRLRALVRDGSATKTDQISVGSEVRWRAVFSAVAPRGHARGQGVS